MKNRIIKVCQECFDREGKAGGCRLTEIEEENLIVVQSSTHNEIRVVLVNIDEKAK